MAAKDKSFAFDFAGVYKEVDIFKKISYVMSEDANDKSARQCEIIFTDLGNGKVKIVETFDAENQNSLEMQKNGWQSILKNFKKAVEAGE
jgi:uncharacterized protein YndB with AHSA1/START domain